MKTLVATFAIVMGLIAGALPASADRAYGKSNHGTSVAIGR